MWGTWGRAHNTLLELAADMGVSLAALVALGWILIFAVLIHGVRGRYLIVPVSALSVAILAVLHLLIDFSLQNSRLMRSRCSSARVLLSRS